MSGYISREAVLSKCADIWIMPTRQHRLALILSIPLTKLQTSLRACLPQTDYCYGHEHLSIVPFDELSVETQNKDKKYVDILRSITKEFK